MGVGHVASPSVGVRLHRQSGRCMELHFKGGESLVPGRVPAGAGRWPLGCCSVYGVAHPLPPADILTPSMPPADGTRVRLCGHEGPRSCRPGGAVLPERNLARITRMIAQCGQTVLRALGYCCLVGPVGLLVLCPAAVRCSQPCEGREWTVQTRRSLIMHSWGQLTGHQLKQNPANF